MKKIFQHLILFSVSSILFSSCLNTNNVASENLPMEEQVNTSVPSPSNFTARFEIITNGTKRIFTDPKYHNQSPDVYLESVNPQVIQIKKATITWNDFFSTLPFSLTKDCLVTGTNQTFCTTQARRLKFYLNGREVPDALDQEIKPDDYLLVEYSAI